MVIIRLARHGTRNAPFYHLTVADRANRRDGRHIERVGFYNPLARGKSESLRVDLDRIDYWLSVGAIPSERVGNLIKHARAAAKADAKAAPAA
ncbi:MAG TPA: 30S ribosomal protein S16 [Pseudomonadales bacterium]|nr:30S ribosomal protein S16 [Pseudomonadales bacterium]